MIVVNIFGGPGIGKTSVATGLFSKIKFATQDWINHSTVYVPEQIKISPLKELQENDYLAELVLQSHAIYSFVDTGIDVVITDGSVLLRAIYNPPLTALKQLALDRFNHPNVTNLNIILQRVKPFKPKDRYPDVGTEIAASLLDNFTANFFEENNIRYMSAPGSEEGITTIYNKIMPFISVRGDRPDAPTDDPVQIFENIFK